jgi:hypothetical protein
MKKPGWSDSRSRQPGPGSAKGLSPWRDLRLTRWRVGCKLLLEAIGLSHCLPASFDAKIEELT